MNKKFKFRIRKIASRLFDGLIINPINYLLPTKNLIILESNSDFTDNSKALFNSMIKYGINKTHEIIWLVEDIERFKDIKIENVKFINIMNNTILNKIIFTIKISTLFAQCKYSFFTHRNYARTSPKKNQVFFNLTHGTPLKNSTGMHKGLRNSTYVLSTSEFAARLRTATYGGGETKVKILGFPRNDFLFEDKDVLLKLGVDSTNYNKYIIWLPTFRRHKNVDRNDTLTNNHNDIPIINDYNEWHELEEFLTKKNMMLIIKPHPAQDMEYFKGKSSESIKLITNQDLLKNDIELYNLIGKSDALITDYSSVYMDYLLLNKAIGFTIDDMFQYGENLGFMLDEPLKYMPGFKIKSFSDLLGFIENVCDEKDDYQDERYKINEIFNDYKDNNSSFRVLKLLKLID